jgi:hypothetical protein
LKTKGKSGPTKSSFFLLNYADKPSGFGLVLFFHLTAIVISSGLKGSTNLLLCKSERAAGVGRSKKSVNLIYKLCHKCLLSGASILPHGISSSSSILGKLFYHYPLAPASVGFGHGCCDGGTLFRPVNLFRPKCVEGTSSPLFILNIFTS